METVTFTNMPSSSLAMRVKFNFMKEEISPQYATASDLPSFIDLQSQLDSLNEWLPFIHGERRRNLRKQIREVQKQSDRLKQLVDQFNELLGPRHWIFTNGFGLTEMRKILDTKDSNVAEQRLLTWHEVNLEGILFLLNKQQGLRIRMPLIRKALNDYFSKRYYSVVYLLIAAVDGFVNDVDPANRRDLTSREPEEMAAYDSVTAVGSALPVVAKIYQTGFHRFSDMNVTEVYRNGIMHGMLVNFDNQIVATKAWNLLFAAADWADACEKRKVQIATPPKTEASLSELIQSSQQISADNEKLEQWEPYETGIQDSDPDSSGIRRDCTAFLEAWKTKNYMRLGSFLPNYSKYSEGKMAGQAREVFKEHQINGGSILRIENLAAAVAYTTISIAPDGDDEYTTRLRWIRVESASGMATSPEWESGRWVAIQAMTDSFEPGANMGGES